MLVTLGRHVEHMTLYIVRWKSVSSITEYTRTHARTRYLVMLVEAY